ncbi:hypothetical protein BX661DRAFT_99986 [Kickxella alabastrina]|uniref:uncharacterized protein n=1 Tax=Kickxella alabastrina TaxID=61397 RepID=UPI0022211C80|nr:uncharacterized protein BX661DRAFT_99986 [Kickxella alabastrina]KAI7829113.1 hypothetical protein BX661DRAFT_99986 [Kickxella alabastrina]
MRPRREKSFHSAHIHAVIYVIPPPVYSSSETDSHCHRVDTAMDVISEIDIQAIRALGQFTSVLLAIGKSDTMEKSDHQVLKNTTYRFYSQVNELIMPTKLFDFTDIPGTQRESPEEVRVFGRRILREMPLFICGSKHVEEWQKMRLPEYLKTEEGGRSPGRGCVADWRSLGSKHNRVRSRSVMITEGIFRNRKSSNPTPILLPADDTQLPEKNSSNEESISPYAPVATRLSQSLVMRSDTVSIQRYDQKREISLVREFGWGTLQLNNPEHCDFALLVDILFHSFRKSLTCWADLFYYERYRMQRIAADSKYFSIHHEMSKYLRMEVDRRAIPVITKHRVVDVTPGEIRGISVVAKSENNADVSSGSREGNLDKVRVPSGNVDYTFGSPFTMPLKLSDRENNFASNRGEFNFYYELPTTSSPTRSILPDTAASKQFYSTRTVVKSQKGSIISSSLSLSLPLPLQPTTPLVSVSASGSNTASSNRSSAATAINTIVALFNPLINIKRHSGDNHSVKAEPVQVNRAKQRGRRNTTSA